ncbi:hypothetical protein Tco_1341759 [Tanacetum coccineum]
MDVDCPKKVTNGIPTQNGNDVLEQVTRKKQKAKQKPRHIEGIRLSKPKPIYVYRPVTKSHPVKTNTTQPNASTHPVNTSMDGLHTTDNDDVVGSALDAEMNYVS